MKFYDTLNKDDSEEPKSSGIDSPDGGRQTTNSFRGQKYKETVERIIITDDGEFYEIIDENENPVRLSDGEFYLGGEKLDLVSCTVHPGTEEYTMNRENANFCTVGGHWTCLECSRIVKDIVQRGRVAKDIVVCRRHARSFLDKLLHHERQSRKKNVLDLLASVLKPHLLLPSKPYQDQHKPAKGNKAIGQRGSERKVPQLEPGSSRRRK